MEASDEQIRQSFIQYRNKAEQTQMELVTMGLNRGWYVPSPPADMSHVSQFKNHCESVIQELEGSPVLTHF